MRAAVRRPPRTALTTGAAALVLLLVPSCGGDDDAASAGGSGDRPAQQPATAATGDTGATSSPSPAARDRPRAAAGDLANFSCTQRRNGVWSAEGNVTNSAPQQRTYYVTVVTVEGADVSGERTEELTLAPEESTGFAMSRISRGPADACLPRLLRAPLS